MLIFPLCFGLVMEEGSQLRTGNASFNVTYNFSVNITFQNNFTIYSDVSLGVGVDALDNVSLRPNSSEVTLQVLAWNVSSKNNNFTLTGNNQTVYYNISVNGSKGYVYYNNTFSYDSFTASSMPTNFFYNTSCVESWTCTIWLDKDIGGERCISGEQVRTCTDVNSCGTTTDKPVTLQSCQPSSGAAGGGNSEGNTNTEIINVTTPITQDLLSLGTEEDDTITVAGINISNKEKLFLGILSLIIVFVTVGVIVLVSISKKKKEKSDRNNRKQKTKQK